MMKRLKRGTRVRTIGYDVHGKCVDGLKGVIAGVPDGNGDLYVKYDAAEFGSAVVKPSQCRILVKAKSAHEIWVPKVWTNEDWDAAYRQGVLDYLAERPLEWNMPEFTHYREVKRKVRE
jgi:hypothetical protein